MVSIAGRALHYVFKIGDRKNSAKFYRDILGMKILRHEEFTEGCEATCNGPYDNRWSKTMVGYGPEDTHFALELTYNYSVGSYKKGNEFLGLTIRSKEVLDRAKSAKWPILPGNILEAPGGYKFYIIEEPQPQDADPVQKVSLACSNLQKSVEYWINTLKLTEFNRTDKSVLLGFAESQVKLELKQIDEAVNRAEAFGRIAFSCPFDQQPIIEEIIQNTKNTILTPLISLDTPDKATVRVIILADPDNHEICFVDDEGFRQLSVFDPKGEMLLDRYIKKDSQEIKKDKE